MRRKDWADVEAERLYDMVRNGLIEDDTIVDEIAKSLRKAAKDFKDERVTGLVGARPDSDEM